jgi:hypothetical protein
VFPTAAAFRNRYVLTVAQEAQQSITGLLRDDSFPKFVRSDLYKKYLRTRCLYPSPPPPAMIIICACSVESRCCVVCRWPHAAQKSGRRS